MTHATDIVAYTYNADIYCPSCIATMFKDDAGPGSYRDTEAILEFAAKAKGIDYPDGSPYDYDSDDFPKVVFSSQANDADWEHCGNSSDPKFAEVCEQHIDHVESECHKWRGIEENDDFRGRTIIWTSPDNQFVLEMTRVYPPTKPDEHGKDQWSYKFFDYSATPLDGPPNRLIFEDDEFWSPDFNDAPEVVSALLSFLSLEDGDTDSEYFEHYTERQLSWRDERAQELMMVRMEQFEE